MGLCDTVRTYCQELLEDAQHVSIDAEAVAVYGVGSGAGAPAPALDPLTSFVEGSPAALSQHLLILDTINFGSGWAPTLRKRRDPATGRTVSAARTTAWNLADHARAEGPWDGAALRAMRTETVAAVLGQPADHELMSLYAQALRELGRFLGDRTATDLVAAAGGSAERFAELLAAGMTLFCDQGFFKRAQIAAADQAIGGCARFTDLARLTAFADNLVPHVLRCDGLIAYDDGLASTIDDERLLAPGRAEREIRAAAVVVCDMLARRLGTSATAIDMALWNRGQEPVYKARPRHRTRSVYY